MAVNALFDDKRRKEIRLALNKGEPVPQGKKPGTPAFAQAMELAEDIQGILAQRSRDGELAQYRADQALIQAVAGRNELAVEAALTQGARVDARRFPKHGTVFVSMDGAEAHMRSVTKNQGDTALMIAVQNNDLEMVKLLISRNADVNLRMNYGSYPTPTALGYAEHLGFADIAEYLRGHGATT